MENNIETIEKLAKIVKDNDLNSVYIKTEEFTIEVRGKKLLKTQVSGSDVKPSGFDGFDNYNISSKPDIPDNLKAPGNIVKSPIIGTFYSSPSPDKPAFVKIGDKIKKGQILCIIESMKLMNELESEFEGTIDEIFLKDGEIVEFGTEIMKIS